MRVTLVNPLCGCREPHLPLESGDSRALLDAHLCGQRLQGTAAAWERAPAHDLAQVTRLSDIQEECPLALADLEAACCR